LKEKTKNPKEVKNSELREKTPKSLKRVRKPKAKEEKQTFKEEESVEVQLSIWSQSTSRSGRPIKTPNKFLSVGEEEQGGHGCR